MHKITSLFLSISFLVSTARADVMFNLTNVGGAGVGTQARTGFQTAANSWSSVLTDDITVNLDIGFASLGANILGGASSVFYTTTFSNFHLAVQLDATSTNDSTFLSNLPTGSTFNPYINRTFDNPNGAWSATPYLDNDRGLNNSSILLTGANAKALGLLSPTNSASDATIRFSSNYTYDFDPSDGIDAGKFDFVALALHEIGHALGFFSEVDFLDSLSVTNVSSHTDDYFNVVSPLDFTRFSSASQSAGADLDWTADTRSKYFSIDGGTTVYLGNAWSTGTNFGDGMQASHWKDNLSLGILDPTLAPGEAGVVRSLDLTALDVIGYNLRTSVPEPATITSVVLICAWVLCRTRAPAPRHPLST